MKVQVVSFRCVLRNKLGEVLSSTVNQDVITHADPSGDSLKGLLEGLRDVQKGDRRRIFLPADQAYGFYDPKQVIEVSRRKLQPSEDLHSGKRVLAPGQDGGMKMFHILEVTGDSVTLDGNHPFAGQDLIFDIEITDARDATSEEIAECSAPVAKPLLH